MVADHQQAVRGFLRRLTGSYADADDLAQETFVTAWSRPGRLRQAQSVRAWLCGIAYRKWLTRRRGEGRRQARETAVWREAQLRPDQGAAPDARLDAATLLAALPHEERAVVALCLAAGFSHDETARSLGLSLGVVKSHLLRGRAKLVNLLGEPDDRT